jgi:hypothetical protein
VVGFDERRKVRRAVAVIVVLDDDARLVSQADDRDPVPVVLGEGGEAEPKGGARAVLLPWRGGLTPVDGVDGPCKWSCGCWLDRRRWEGGVVLTNMAPRIVIRFLETLFLPLFL